MAAKHTENGWDKDKIVILLDTNPRAVERALIAIYRRQTASEQAAHTTREHNGVGFSGADAPLLTDIAQRCLKFGGLTDRQVALVRRKIKKYWRQLLDIVATHPKQAT